MSIGHKIKTLRRAKELTQEELAEVLGISSKAISQWECNRTAPDISQLPMLCNFFEVTADELTNLRDKKYALFSLLFEKGDYGFFAEHLAVSHEMQARECAKRQNKEKCLYHLEQAAKHALDFISYMKSENFVHTSLLWKNFSNPSSGVSLWEEENIATLILSRTELSEYDFLRVESRFLDLVKCLSASAGCNDY